MHSKKILTTIHTFLSISGVYGSFPMSLLVVVLEVLIEYKFSCACSYEQTFWLITFIFTGPFVFTFALMFILLRPCRYSVCPSEEPKDRFKFWKALGHCLIPPVIWIIVLLLDGDYLACGLATWKGNYVFDEEINRMWCKPEQALALNTRLLQQMYEEFICDSQLCGYIGITFFGIVSIFLVAIYDCLLDKGPEERMEEEEQVEERDNEHGDEQEG